MDFDSKGRIAKMNIQFSKLLEDFETNDTAPTTISTDIPDNSLSSTPESVVSQNYYANMIEKSRTVKNVHNYGIPLNKNIENIKKLDAQLESIYQEKKKNKSSTTIYNMAGLYEENKDKVVSFSYSSIPEELALIQKKDWKEMLLADVDFKGIWQYLNRDVDFRNVWETLNKDVEFKGKLAFLNKDVDFSKAWEILNRDVDFGKVGSAIKDFCNIQINFK